MADSTISARLRQLIEDMRAEIELHSKTASPVAVSLRRSMTERLATLREITAEIEIAREDPQAGTHAYELIAATEAANIENTETLIHLVAATVLCNLGEREVSFTPADMDHMHQHFIMSAVRDGMSTTVKIERRDESLPPMALQPGIDASPAKPQAPEHVYDRPLWAVRVGNKLIPALDRIDAETRQAMEGALATVENRFCYHPDCPSTKCQRAPSGDGAAEVTSAA